MGGFIIFLMGVVVLAAFVGWFRAREDEGAELTPGLGESFAHLFSFTGGKSAGQPLTDGTEGAQAGTGARAKT